MSPLAGKELNTEKLLDTLYYFLAITLAKVKFSQLHLAPIFSI